MRLFDKLAGCCHGAGLLKREFTRRRKTVNIDAAGRLVVDSSELPFAAALASGRHR